jgi:DnaJ-class molecular chaperone
MPTDAKGKLVWWLRFVPSSDPCGACGGEGALEAQDLTKQPCAACGGTGKVSGAERWQVRGPERVLEELNSQLTGGIWRRYKTATCVVPADLAYFDEEMARYKADELNADLHREG